MASTNFNVDVKVEVTEVDDELASLGRSEIKIEKVPDVNDRKRKYEDSNNSIVEVSSCSMFTIKTEYVPNEGTNGDENKNKHSEITSSIKSEIDAPVQENKKEDENIDELSLKSMPESYRETYGAFLDVVKALSSVPILESLSEESIRNFKPYNIRYYEDKYCINFGVKETRYCDINIRIHSNKLILIALASGNHIIRSQKDISEVNFVVNNVDRSQVQLKGKKKFGSKAVETHTILCQVKYQGDDKIYNVRAGVNGRIIEINELIKTNPNLIRTDPKGLGFIAVVAPKGRPQDYEKNVSKLDLLSEEEYFQHLLQRPVVFAVNS